MKAEKVKRIQEKSIEMMNLKKERKKLKSKKFTIIHGIDYLWLRLLIIIKAKKGGWMLGLGRNLSDWVTKKLEADNFKVENFDFGNVKQAVIKW